MIGWGGGSRVRLVGYGSRWHCWRIKGRIDSGKVPGMRWARPTGQDADSATASERIKA